MTPCRVRIGWSAFESWMCGRDAGQQVTVGCVHEHMETVPACDRCALVIGVGWSFCSQCSEVDGHECVVSIVLMEPLAVTESSP